MRITNDSNRRQRLSIYKKIQMLQRFVVIIKIKIIRKIEKKKTYIHNYLSNNTRRIITANPFMVFCLLFIISIVI